MRHRQGQRGEGQLNLIVALAVLAIAIFAAVKYIPVKIAAFEFRDFIEQECRTAALRKDNAYVQKRILDKAEELEIPLDKKNLTIKRTASEMIIQAKYMQPIDFKFMQYDYQFDHKYRAPLF